MNFISPSNQLFRGIELKLLKENAEEYLNIKGRKLDLGCGNGEVAKCLFKQKVNYGLDINQTALNSARKKNIYKNLLLSKAEKIPLKDNSLDLIFSNCTLEHIKDLDSVLSEAKRVLKNKGFFVFTVPSSFYAEYNFFSKTGIRVLAKLYGWLRNKKLNHYHVYSLDQWRKLLKKHSFSIVNHYYYHNQKTIFIWDILFWLNPFFQLTNWQPQFIKDKVTQLISKSESREKEGATLCICARSYH